MNSRAYYFIAAVASVALLFSLPVYFNWFFGGILYPPISYSDQAAHLEPRERMVIRYGNSYVVYMQTTGIFRKAQIRDAVLLLPPDKYLKDNGVIDFNVAEPSEFYYYTGYKAVWPGSPEVRQAGWVLVPRGPIVMLRRIHGKEDFDQLLKLYEPYLTPL